MVTGFGMLPYSRTVIMTVLAFVFAVGGFACGPTFSYNLNQLKNRLNLGYSA